MSDFVEQCRLEWKRIGVPDRLAEEMAADLAADLGEAEAEGVSAEQFLGSSFSDPRVFAASWAAERGIVPEPPRRGNGGRWPLVLAAYTAVAALTLVVAAALLATGEPKLTLRTSGHPAGLGSLPPGVGGQVHTASAAEPVEWILLFLAIVALGFAVWLWSSWGRSRPPAAAV